MKLFSRRERIAIIVLCLTALVGTGIRLILHKQYSQQDIRIIKNAVDLPAEIEKAAAKKSGELELLININRASQEELETLPLIGSSRAKAIIDFRKRHGAFQRLSDIQKVPGIGEGIFSRIAPFITLSPDTTLSGY